MSANARPLSPHIGIYRWQIQMVTSILHRATGIALVAGTILLVVALLALAAGPQAWDCVATCCGLWFGTIILIGWTWSLAFHFFSGVRHLTWDLGYGFTKRASRQASIGVIALSLIAAVAVFACIWSGHGGYLR